MCLKGIENRKEHTKTPGPKLSNGEKDACRPIKYPLEHYPSRLT